MIEAETIIVGGGPAGSACAWKLKQRGRDSIILDKQTFPRLKLCGGWITPQVAEDLELHADRYPRGLLTFEKIHFHFPKFGFSTTSRQHSVRRYEFDAWLLERAGVPVHEHEVREIRRESGYYVLDGAYRARYLVGAGGTACPVYRSLFREINAHPKYLQTATLEQEFAYDYTERDCHLWFGHQGLPGYAWYVPKANGYVNVGIGAMSVQMKFSDKDIHEYWQALTGELRRRGLVTGHDFQPKGYSYFLRNPVQMAQSERAFLVGDAAGLATWDLAEGIGPAIRSAILAAEAIATGKPYSLASVGRYSGGSALLGFPFKYLFVNKSRAAARRLVHQAATS